MKTYEEMAESALKTGLELRRKEQKRRKLLLRTGAVTVCLALIAGVLWAGQSQVPEMPTEPENGPEPAVNGPVQITDGLPNPGENLRDPIPVPQDPTVRTESTDPETDDKRDVVFPPYAGKDGEQTTPSAGPAADPSEETINWWCVRIENAYSSYGEAERTNCYASPDNGEFFCSPMIERAMEELDDDALLGVKIYLFRDGERCGEEAYREAAKQLTENGISVSVGGDLVNAEAYGTEPEDTLQNLWTKDQIEQIRTIAESGDYGWFMFFYDQII